MENEEKEREREQEVTCIGKAQEKEAKQATRVNR